MLLPLAVLDEFVFSDVCRSRAVAVSASCDYFGVFMLKKPPVLQTQMLQNQLDPIAEVSAVATLAPKEAYLTVHIN